MEDQPLPADASPTALSLDYVVDSDPEKDEKDPKEDPAYYPADRGNNDDDESSNDDDDDDDVEKDEEDKEEEDHPAPADHSDVSTDDLEIERVVAQRVANAIEAIAIYETKTNLAHKSMSQTERQEEKVAENASNKRKWKGNHNGSLSQQNKGHKETMTNISQGMSVEEIERVVAQRVANDIEAIAIYETKTNLAHKSMSQTKRQEEEVVENASNKTKDIRCLEHTLLGQSTRMHLMDLYLYATSANLTIVGRAL
nr:hypothetical protein [Tanacetum cinerariifolium]